MVKNLGKGSRYSFRRPDELVQTIHAYVPSCAEIRNAFHLIDDLLPLGRIAVISGAQTTEDGLAIHIVGQTFAVNSSGVSEDYGRFPEN